MKIGFYQFEIRPSDPEANLQTVLDALKPETFDLVVLPEFFTTGYLFPSREAAWDLSEPVSGGRTSDRLSDLSRSKQAFIVGNIPERSRGNLYNSSFLVGPDGYIGKQRKRHLPNIERAIFEEGNEIEAFQVRDTSIGIVTCFDAWFPEYIRLLLKNKIRILCHPANFGGTMTLDIMRARAIENRIFTVTANRIGGENLGGVEARFRGESRIIDPDGNILVQADDSECLRIIDIDPGTAFEKKTHMADFRREWDRYRVEKTDERVSPRRSAGKSV